jgi:hypothetical protein
VAGATEPSGKEFGGDHERGEVWPDLKKDLAEDVEEGYQWDRRGTFDKLKADANCDEKYGQNQEAEELNDTWRHAFDQSDHAETTSHGPDRDDDEGVPGVVEQVRIYASRWNMRRLGEVERSLVEDFGDDFVGIRAESVEG